MKAITQQTNISQIYRTITNYSQLQIRHQVSKAKRTGKTGLQEQTAEEKKSIDKVEHMA